MLKKLAWIFLSAIASGPAWAQSDTVGVEIRKPRSWGLSAEIGFNSLASMAGPVATYYPKPGIAVDVGSGVLSVGGFRPGIRARYLFTPLDKTSYFGGIGYKYGVGSAGEAVKVEDPDTQDELEIVVDPSSFLDGMLGVEFLADNGFLVIATVGYSQLLGGKYYTVTSGAISEKGRKTFDFIFGSGIMLSVSLGKAF